MKRKKGRYAASLSESFRGVDIEGAHLLEGFGEVCEAFSGASLVIVEVFSECKELEKGKRLDDPLWDIPSIDIGWSEVKFEIAENIEQ